jgi:hypothetical protein
MSDSRQLQADERDLKGGNKMQKGVARDTRDVFRFLSFLSERPSFRTKKKHNQFQVITVVF